MVEDLLFVKVLSFATRVSGVLREASDSFIGPSFFNLVDVLVFDAILLLVVLCMGEGGGVTVNSR